MGTVMDRERLAAYVDGALEPEEAARVVMHLADHPEDQAFVDSLGEINQLLARAYGAPLREPVPERFERLLRGQSAKVVPLHARKPQWLLPVGGLAAAAAVAALVIGLTVTDGDTDAAFLAVGPVMEDSDLHTALEQNPSGHQTELDSGHELTLIATFESTAGYCREIEALNSAELTFTRAIACRGSDHWDIAVSVSEPIRTPDQTQDYLPAGDTAVVALSAALDALGAGPTLPRAAEHELIAAGWES